MNEALSKQDPGAPGVPNEESPNDPPATAPARFISLPEPISAPPPWAKVPTDLVFPHSLSPLYVLFRAEWTYAPKKGDRQCILWPLSDADEFQAAQRSANFPTRAFAEQVKGTIRAVDGYKADWTGRNSPGSIDVFWREIGMKCRGMLDSLFVKMHVLGPQEQADFFESCVVQVAPAG